MYTCPLSLDYVTSSFVPKTCWQRSHVGFGFLSVICKPTSQHTCGSRLTLAPCTFSHTVNYHARSYEPHEITVNQRNMHVNIRFSPPSGTCHSPYTNPSNTKPIAMRCMDSGRANSTKPTVPSRSSPGVAMADPARSDNPQPVCL